MTTGKHQTVSALSLSPIVKDEAAAEDEEAAVDDEEAAVDDSEAVNEVVEVEGARDSVVVEDCDLGLKKPCVII